MIGKKTAVYAFTAVAIMFLPPSTISSVVGIDSGGVSDMEARAVGVLGSGRCPQPSPSSSRGFWWMEKNLHNFVNWLRGLPPRRKQRPMHEVSRPGCKRRHILPGNRPAGDNAI
ncbi:hypothetical protein F4804DRAFT_84927 [Jackrogersella minutella]|nr:hypothetical protein F4804DRAFT_84927 [Jackrogersella minutella]